MYFLERQVKKYYDLCNGKRNVKQKRLDDWVRKLMIERESEKESIIAKIDPNRTEQNSDGLVKQEKRQRSS